MYIYKLGYEKCMRAYARVLHWPVSAKQLLKLILSNYMFSTDMFSIT